MAPINVASKRSVPETQLRAWGACLQNPYAPLVERSRALWGLRHAGEPLATELLCSYLSDVVEPSPAANALLQHEVAYCLGQRGDLEAVPVLANVMRNSHHHPVVRHEAAEALAALCEFPGAPIDAIENLFREYVDCDTIELAHTCGIGLGRLAWLRQQPKDFPNRTIAKDFFPDTIDPAPGFDPEVRGSPIQLRDLLINPDQPLFTRYQALFSLRDYILEAKLYSCANGPSANELATLLAEGLTAPGSALLRHEVAYVLGQLAMQVTVPDLAECLQRVTEHPMARHEAAEALGAVAGQIEAGLASSGSEEASTFAKAARCVLRHSLTDKEQLVRESCVLALDIADYVCSTDQFHYPSMPC
ncbi:unnamed protein product [Dicrocoelium dendriticum]|nr:unnamed protein product [Dicrocoelium dendriticum]